MRAVGNTMAISFSGWGIPWTRTFASSTPTLLICTRPVRGQAGSTRSYSGSCQGLVGRVARHSYDASYNHRTVSTFFHREKSSGRVEEWQSATSAKSLLRELCWLMQKLRRILLRTLRTRAVVCAKMRELSSEKWQITRKMRKILVKWCEVEFLE